MDVILKIIVGDIDNYENDKIAVQYVVPKGNEANYKKYSNYKDLEAIIHRCDEREWDGKNGYWLVPERKMYWLLELLDNYNYNVTIIKPSLVPKSSL